MEKAVAGLGVTAENIKVTAYADILAYQVLATPGLESNEKLVVAGRIPSEQDVTAWLQAALAAV